MDNKKLILRNAEELRQEGVAHQGSCNNCIFESTMLVKRLCFQYCSVNTVFLLFSVQPHRSQLLPMDAQGICAGEELNCLRCSQFCG